MNIGDKKIFSYLIERYEECRGKEYKDIDAYKEIFKTAQSLIKNSTNLSDKQRIELHIIKGNIQDNVRENVDGAINEYKKALKIDSEDWTIWYNLGVSYGRKGEADLAISIYKKVIKINPESGASYYNRAVQYLTKNEFDKACEDFHCAQRLGIDSSIPIKKFCITKEQDDIGKYMEQHTIDPEEINPEDFIR
jgi:tetratricopeptide (TPR) repeat protein